MKKLLGILVLGLLSTNPSWSGVPCIGWEDKTKNLVLGDCSSNLFSGWVQKTNANILGTCDANMIMAWNDETGYMIWGNCDTAYGDDETYKKYKLNK